MGSWYKHAYSYVEELLRTISDLLPNAGANTNQLVSAYKNLDANRTDTKALAEASRILRQQGMEDISQKGWWNQWETSGNILDKISVNPSNDPSQPATIQLLGLNFGNSKVSQSIQQQMGGWMELQKIPDGPVRATYNVNVRGTQESWNKFVQLASGWLENHEVLAKKKFAGGLPSEQSFNADYAEPAAEEEQAERFMQVFPLNSPDNPQSLSSYTPKSKKEPMTTPPGVRLSFAENDKLFPQVRDLVVKARAKKSESAKAEFNPREIRVGWGDKTIDIFSNDPQKWATVSKRLQFLGYPTKESGLNDLISSFTGQAIGMTYKELAKKETGAGPTDVVLQGRIAKNLLQQPVLGDRFNIDPNYPLSEEEFGNVLVQNYPNAFKTPEAQQEAQKKGIYFSTTRGVSLLADEPGSGKTMQAVIAADVVRDEGQKVLVITPSMLIRENWIADVRQQDGTEKQVAKSPAQYCGHGPENIAVCKDAESIKAAVADPQVIWVVVPINAFGRKGQKSEDFVNAIASAEKKKVFSSLIFDEIQTVKNPKSITFGKMARSVSAHHIPHRIGLTGTPSDDNPNSIYSQMLLLRHPMLFDDKGIEKWVLSKKFRNQNGFADMFLGGSKLSDSVSIPKKDRDHMTEAEQEEERSDLWRDKANEVLKWVKSLTNDRKIQILNLFSSTYIRRNKTDIREDMPPLRRNVVGLPLPSDVKLPSSSQNWHVSLLKEMAHRKAPYTIQRAAQYLQDPSQKLFIVTKHPEIADEIAEGLNRWGGLGIAAAVHQDTKDEMRTSIAETFREQNMVLPKDDKNNFAPVSPLRAVVYTQKLGAVGLNFAIANKAIFNDIDWNPSDNLQAEYRVHRIDSENDVDIDYMVFENSYDHEMYKRVEKKQYINDNVSNLIKDAQGASNQEEKIVIANKFIKYLIASVLIDVGMRRDDQAEFERQLEIALVSTPQQPVPIAASGHWYNRMKKKGNIILRAC